MSKMCACLYICVSSFVEQLVSITRLSPRIGTMYELQLVFLPLYLEPVLVINDRETNPMRHEFYIRLFICTDAALLHSNQCDGSTELGMQGKIPQYCSCAVSFLHGESIIISADEKIHH